MKARAARALVTRGEQLGVAELGALKAGRVPELTAGLLRPGSYVEVGLGMIIVPRRGAVSGPLAPPLGAQVDRDVEVVGPELDARRIPVDLVGSQLLEHRAAEAVVVAEGACRGDLHAGDRLPRLLRAGLPDQLAVLDPDLAIHAVLIEERGAEATARVAQRDLVRGQSGGGDDRLGDLVECHPGLGEGRRQGLESRPCAKPAVGAPGSDLRVLDRDLVPGVIAAVVHRRDQLTPLWNLSRIDRIVGVGIIGDRGGRGLQDARLVVPAKLVLGLGPGVRHQG